MKYDLESKSDIGTYVASDWPAKQRITVKQYLVSHFMSGKRPFGKLSWTRGKPLSQNLTG